MNKANNKIRIAVQNKGRLMEPSLAYLKKCGLKFTENGRSLIVPCKNSDVEILFVRNSDIPEYVRYSVADFGIVGKNVLMEKENNLKTVQELDFGKCSLVIAVPKSSKIKKLTDLDHERVATSYPRILKNFLKKQKVSASIIEIRGSVEICPSLGLADAIFDITQTGRTLSENGLKVVEKVADSQAVLIQNPNSNLREVPKNPQWQQFSQSFPFWTASAKSSCSAATPRFSLPCQNKKSCKNWLIGGFSGLPKL